MAPTQHSRPVLFVLVVGETARAHNFSLNGYGRDTNPELARRNVISYPDAVACGTSTEVSLPCMFSPYGRAHYDEEKRPLSSVPVTKAPACRCRTSGATECAAP
jgi:glucan phosphoethanolaminetransferase (alkaline phosphatase superfamily)